MQWLWILPSLAFGVYLFITTGQPTGLIFAAFSTVALLGTSLFGGRREPVDPRGQVHITAPAAGSWRVAIGNRVLPRWQWRWKAAWVGRVYEELSRLNDQQRSNLELQRRLGGSIAAPKPNALQAWVGYSGAEPVTIDLASDGAHGLIIGATGAGKSQLLTTWLVSLLQGYAPDELQLWLVDFKGGATLAPFSMLPWTSRYATNTEGSAGAVLEDLVREMTQRERLLAENEVGRIEDVPEIRRPARILLAIDEAQSLLVDPSTHPALQALAARGRSLGIHLLLTGQSLAGIPRALVTNLGVRLLLGRADAVELAQLGFQRQMIAGGAPVTDAPPANLPGWGSAVLISPRSQLSFSFPSLGKVGIDRLQFARDLKQEKVFSEVGGPFGAQNDLENTESVVIPTNTFDFSIGIEKQLQLTAESVRE